MSPGVFEARLGLRLVLTEVVVAMHQIFQNFVDGLSEALEREALRDAMAGAATALDLSCFAYLTIPPWGGSAP